MDEWGIDEAAVHNSRREGERLMSFWRRMLLDRIAGPDPESKRGLSTLLAGIGALGMGLSFVDGIPGWVGPTGLFTVLLAWALLNAASGQQRVEIRARDRIEWGREAQRLRRSVGPIWTRLSGPPFRIYAEAIGYGGTFAEMLDMVGWPDRKNIHTPGMEGFVREVFPPPGHRSLLPEAQRGTFRLLALGQQRELVADWETAKDILEIWSIALHIGGSRAPALRVVIHRLEQNHLDSIRLMWFLSIAHTKAKPFAENADYSFVSDIRDVMEGRT